MDRVFLDANVLFSAAYSEQNRLHELWQIDDVECLTSQFALMEAERNLDDVAALNRLRELARRTTILQVPSRFALAMNLATDTGQAVELPTKDWPILLGAIEAKASHLLTGDRRHFGPLFGATVSGVLILSPGEYLLRKSM